MIAITHRLSPRMSACELSFLEREPIDLELAAAQHRAYERALAAAGAEVQSLACHLDQPDAVFVEDPALVLDEIAVITRLGTPARRGESRGIADALRTHRPLLRMEAPGQLDGGDVLRVQRTLYAGLSARSDRAGHAALAALLAPYGYRVVSVPVRDCLHLKTACTALDDHTLIGNPQWCDPGAFEGFTFLPVDPEEPHAANTLRVGATLFVSAAHPRTRERIERAGFACTPLELGEIEKAEGGLTCLSLLFERSAR